MKKVTCGTRPFNTYIPRHVLQATSGEHSAVLLERMGQHRMNIQKLARATGLNPTRVQETVFGEKPPVTTRGAWTKAAVRIAGALRTDPETIFEPIIEQIGSALALPDSSLLPNELVPEIHPEEE